MGLGAETYWVIDVEGNGANPPEIIELAMVLVRGETVTDISRQCLIKPERPITPQVTRIHGLTNHDVVNAPSMEDMASDLMELLEGFAIVGHNVRVELDLLTRALEGWTPVAAIDTLRLARLLLPEFPSHSLEAVGRALGHYEETRRRSGQGMHAALFDATLTALVFVDLIGRLAPAARSEALRLADLLASDQPSLL